MDKDIMIVEVENPNFNGHGECNNCHKTIYWNKAIRNRTTKRQMPLEHPYKEGETPSRHLCMQRGTTTGKYINKYEQVQQIGLKLTWCEFCNHYFDLSHWCIFKSEKYKVTRPYLMCMKEVQMCNHGDHFEPLTNGWFRK